MSKTIPFEARASCVCVCVFLFLINQNANREPPRPQPPTPTPPNQSEPHQTLLIEPGQMPPKSVQLAVYHFLLMICSALTILDCLVILFSFDSKEFNQILNWTIVGGKLLLTFLIIIRLLAAIVVLATGIYYGARYDHVCHVRGHLFNIVMVITLLFLIGIVMNYQVKVWSLVLQIIQLYIGLIYTFKCFLYHSDDAFDSRLDFGRRANELGDNEGSVTPSWDRAASRSPYGKFLYFTNKNLMAISTVVMMILSLLICILLRHTITKPWSERKLMNLKFVGEIFIRVLLSLIVPLIGSSIAYACTGFDPKSSGRLMSELMVYYVTTTALATITGLTMVSLIQPGHRTKRRPKPLTNTTTEKPPSDSPAVPVTLIMIEDTILDMIRNLFTDNIFKSWMSTYHTKLLPPLNNLNMNDSDNWRIIGYQEPGANVMSVVLVGFMFGVTANLIKTRGGRTIVELVEAINTMMMMITLGVTQAAPLCTVFLIIPQILAVENIMDMLSLVSWFTLTVILSLAFHALITLSLLYLLMTRKNPYNFLSLMFPAISTAFATSSSNASMSVLMQCLEDDAGILPSIVRFVIPFGATINMDGAALYEAVAAIFVAQYRQRDLNLGQLITIAMTSVLVSVGAAGIPQAGMITTVVVLNSVGLSLEDAALVVVVDFMLDRFRTVVNILGDAFGAAIIGHRLGHIIAKQPDKQPESSDNTPKTEKKSPSRPFEKFEKSSSKSIKSLKNSKRATTTESASVSSTTHDSFVNPQSMQTKSFSSSSENASKFPKKIQN